MIPTRSRRVPSWSSKPTKKPLKRALPASLPNWKNWAASNQKRCPKRMQGSSPTAWQPWDTCNSWLEGILMKNGLIAPHGGELILNMAGEQERAELQEHARSLPRIEVGSRQLADLEMLAI